ncbi:M56 family metallopeptidase [Maribellus sediminis]|uniref:M56 family metallopeptidase n=1 Tax=Maribellus sediminis TaxID=2696285 RepID=UPI0014304319|nr:M56 family metallopeptidase [Maribellus sediminis]
MNPFLVWLLKSSVSLALLYAVFKLAVCRDKMHTANRFVLLGILLTSVILPFANIPLIRETQVIPQFETIHEWVAAPVANELVIYTENLPLSEPTPAKAPLNLWLLFYLSVIGLLVVRVLFSVVRVMQLIRRAEKQNFRDVVLAIVKDLIQPFSFLQHIVLSEKDFTENHDIVVAHEYAHIQHKHALDLMICELFAALFWFNPVVWLLRRDLKLIHEYQADEAVLNKGIDAKTYQLLVLKKAVGERRFALASHFTQKPILKRIKMMHMKTNRRRTSLKLVLFVPVLALLLQAFARPEMIPNKISDLVPTIGVQKDSSEVWLDNWSIQHLSKINDGLEMNQFEVAPPPPESNQERFPKYDKTKHGDPIPSENIMTILVNRESRILACGSFATIDGVLDGVTKFLNGNPPFEQVKNGPEVITKNLPLVGDVKISRGVITLRYDAETDKAFVDKMLRSIGKIYLEKRQQLSQAEFKQDYFSLSAEKKNVINQMLPVRFSIMEPKVTSSVAPPPPPPPFVNVKITKEGAIYVERYYVEPKAKDEKWQLIENKELTIEELKEYLAQRRNLVNEGNRKTGTNHEQGVNVTVENGASDKVVAEVKETLFFTGIKNANFRRASDDTSSSQHIGKYDVRVYPDKFEVFNKVSTVENVKQEVEEYLKSMGDKTTISVLSFSDVPKERLRAVLNELNQVPFVKVSTTVLKLEQEPVSTAQHKILLKANGKIDLDNKEYNLNAFETKINQIGKQPGETNVVLTLEDDVTYLQSETVLNVLRKANINQVGYSIERHSVRETEPGTKIGESVNMFWFGWSGNSPELEKAKREAKKFLSGKGNRSLYAGITPDENATSEDIEAVKNALIEAGFLKVDVRTRQN